MARKTFRKAKSKVAIIEHMDPSVENIIKRSIQQDRKARRFFLEGIGRGPPLPLYLTSFRAFLCRNLTTFPSLSVSLITFTRKQQELLRQGRQTKMGEYKLIQSWLISILILFSWDSLKLTGVHVGPRDEHLRPGNININFYQ